ncbi:uncharacterized protein BDV17DRAFT_106557 [Aspergillus undulatus]|uniref:uncharacterized protein n=1 Tax=Aspergillus undulatus TaxID=1810928 RepID=UPI003CCC9CAA
MYSFRMLVDSAQKERPVNDSLGAVVVCKLNAQPYEEQTYTGSSGARHSHRMGPSAPCPDYPPSLSPSPSQSDSGESLPTDPTGQIELSLLDSTSHAHAHRGESSRNRNHISYRTRTFAEWLEDLNTDPVPCGYLVFMLILVAWAVGTVILVGV